MRLIPHRDKEFGLGTFQNRMNRLFDSFLGETDVMPTTEQLWPAIDVIDTPETLQIKAELPGIDPKDIDVSIVQYGTGHTSAPSPSPVRTLSGSLYLVV